MNLMGLGSLRGLFIPPGCCRVQTFSMAQLPPNSWHSWPEPSARQRNPEDIQSFVTEIVEFLSLDAVRPRCHMALMRR